ncbi:MAG: LysE/ArgO family amino acid transporter [Kofleriaceae bacterium]
MGIAAGAITGVPIGPVNVAVIDAAYRHTLRRAIGVALGGAAADGLYSGVGQVWVSPLLETYPGVTPVLYAVSGLILLVYGFVTARSQPIQAAPTDVDHPVTVDNGREMWSGFTSGLLLIVLNPAAVLMWVVLMSRFIPTPTTSEAIAFTFGVVAGSFGWFALVAHLTHRGKSVLGDKAAWIPRVIGIGLMAYAVYLLARAVKGFVA